MTKEEIIEIIHKTIYQFFDVCGDNEEVPMSDKDKLLLEVNKAICNNLESCEDKIIDDHYWQGFHNGIRAEKFRAGKREPCADCVNRTTVLALINDVQRADGFKDYSQYEYLFDQVDNMPMSVPTQKWIPCSERLPKESGFYLVSTTDCITIMEFCKGWVSQNIGSCNWYVKAWQPLPKPYKEMGDEDGSN